MTVTSLSFASFSFTVKNTSPTSGQFACTYSVTAWQICDGATPTPCCTAGCTGGELCYGPWVIAPGATYTFTSSCSGSANWSSLSVTVKTGSCNAMTFGNSSSNAQGNCSSCTTSTYLTVWDKIANGQYEVRADQTQGCGEACRQAYSNKNPAGEMVFDYHAYMLDKTLNPEKIPQDNNPLVSLLENFPNPALDVLNINYELTQDAEVAVFIYDITGKEVLNLSKGMLIKGKNSITIDVSSLSAGMYTYAIKASETVLTRKFNIVK